MADAMRTLPDAELEVMQAIWACEEPVKRAAISAILNRPRCATLSDRNFGSFRGDSLSLPGTCGKK